MLSTGGATPDSGEKCVSMAISHFHSPLPPSRRMTFVGGTAIPSPFAPHSGSNTKQRGLLPVLQPVVVPSGAGLLPRTAAAV